MDGGYFIFSSILDPEKYLGFNRNGKPINYFKEISDSQKNPKKNHDKQCYKIFKRITEESSNGLSTSTIDYGPSKSLAPTSNNVHHHHHHHQQQQQQQQQHHHRHKTSPSTTTTTTRIHQKTHSYRIETSKSRSTSPQTSSKRNKTHPHPVRHHHNQQPLRRNHTISNNNDNKNMIDSNDNNMMSITKQLGNEDLNAIYNPSDNVNNISESKIKPTAHNRQMKKQTHSSVSKLSTTKKEPNLDDSLHKRKDPNSNDNMARDENNNDTNNCTYCTKNNMEDETDDKNLRGSRKKSRNNADKSNNKGNNHNRRHRTNNNTNERPVRKPSQKSSSHKNQTSEPLNLN